MPLSKEDLQSMYGRDFAPDAGPSSSRFGWGDRFGASVDSAQAGLLGVGEAMGAASLGDARRRNQFEGEVGRYRAIQDTGAPESVFDIRGPSSLAKGLGGLLTDSAPQLATSLAAGVIGGPGLGLGTAGRIGLAAAAGSPYNMGDILQNQREEAGRTNTTSAAALTIPYTAADMVGLDRLLATGKGLRATNKRLDDMTGARGAAARLGTNTALNFGAEGAGETLQEMANQAGRISVNPEQTMFNPEANERYLESFVAGGLLGGSIGGAAGGWRRSQGWKPPTPPADPNAPQDLLGSPTPPTDPDAYDANYGEPYAPVPPGGLTPQRPQNDPAYTGFGNEDPAYAYDEQSPYDAPRSGPVPGANQAAPIVEEYDENGKPITTPHPNVKGAVLQDDPSPAFPYATQNPDDPRVVAQDNLGLGGVDQQGADALYGQEQGNPGLAEARRRFEEQQRQQQAQKEAVDAAKQKFEQRRLAATQLLVDPNPDGSFPIKLAPRELDTYSKLEELLANNVINAQQHTELVGQIKEALQVGDKKTLNAVAKQVKELIDPKPAPLPKPQAAPAAPAQGAANVSAPSVPGGVTGGSSVAGSPVTAGGVAVPGPSPVTGNNAAGAPAVMAPNAAAVPPVAAGPAPAPAVAPAAPAPAPAVTTKKARIVAPGAITGEALKPKESAVIPKDANKIVTLSAKDAALARIKAKAGRLNSGLDPELLADYAIVAAYHIEAGARAFAAYSKAMVADLGEDVRPYLRQLFTKANKDLAAKETENDLTAVNRAGRLDMDMLDKALKGTPAVHKAVRYYLGIDDDGTRIPSGSQEEAAVRAGLGKGSQATVSNALRALGVTKPVRTAFMSGTDRVSSLEPETETLTPLERLQALNDARMEDFAEILTENGQMVGRVEGVDVEGNTDDDAAGSEAFDGFQDQQVGGTQTSSKGGESDDRSGLLPNSLRAAKFMKGVRTDGIDKTPTLLLLQATHLGGNYITDDDLSGRETARVTNYAADNTKLLADMMKEVEKRFKADRAGTMAAHAEFTREQMKDKGPLLNVTAETEAQQIAREKAQAKKGIKRDEKGNATSEADVSPTVEDALQRDFERVEVSREDDGITGGRQAAGPGTDEVQRTDTQAVTVTVAGKKMDFGDGKSALAALDRKLEKLQALIACLR